eukprot:1156230-Pelagomonas_calceolata.AAC.2
MARVHPTRDVQQGCLLSLLLFSLYINNVDSIAEDVRWAVTGTEDVHLTHTLNVYARKKYLIINTAKPEVVRFNSDSEGSNLPAVKTLPTSIKEKRIPRATIMIRSPGQARGERQQGGGPRIESLWPGWR